MHGSWPIWMAGSLEVAAASRSCVRVEGHPGAWAGPMGHAPYRALGSWDWPLNPRDVPGMLYQEAGRPETACGIRLLGASRSWVGEDGVGGSWTKPRAGVWGGGAPRLCAASTDSAWVPVRWPLA